MIILDVVFAIVVVVVVAIVIYVIFSIDIMQNALEKTIKIKFMA